MDLELFNLPIPRYTSYPTAPAWKDFTDYPAALAQVGDKPVSVYVHIPFCRSMCLYCGCSVVLNRREDRKQEYVDALLAEIAMVGRRNIRQLHFGGGTPTELTEGQLAQIMCAIGPVDGEVSIEVDPRTSMSAAFLKSLGFNRISFGVQDTNDDVQRAVRRNQTLEMTTRAFHEARGAGFSSINMDLIYGLPLQTTTTFAQTIEDVIALSPDRIALFSYAKVPWLKAHQKAIREEQLPDTHEKFAIYANARKRLIEAGYVAIGMDHFARAHDEIAIALGNKALQRNFQGYSLRLAEDMIGLGVTSIGFVSGCYTQNVKELGDYYALVRSGQLPVVRGLRLSREDQMRKWIIHKWMCDFAIDSAEFEAVWGQKMPHAELGDLVEKGLLHADRLEATELGALLIRHIASRYDQYLDHGHYSRAI